METKKNIFQLSFTTSFTASNYGLLAYTLFYDFKLFISTLFCFFQSTAPIKHGKTFGREKHNAVIRYYILGE